MKRNSFADVSVCTKSYFFAVFRLLNSMISTHAYGLPVDATDEYM
jgi:hypothetical protein